MGKPKKRSKSGGPSPLPIIPPKSIEPKLRVKSINDFLDAIIENIPHMVFVKEASELRFVRFNKAGEVLLGYDRTDMIGKNDYDFFPPEQAEFFTKKDREALNKKSVTDIPEEPIQTKKGPRWLHTKKIPITDENGTPIFLLGISEDITEQKKAREQLLHFADIFKTTSDFVGFAQASDLQMMYINPAGKQMCGIPKNKNLSEYNLEDILSEPTKELLQKEIIPGSINSGSWEGEVTLINLENKREIPVSMLFLSHKNEDGKVERFSTISRDISETKEREQKILSLYQELEGKTAFLEASNKEIDSFTYIISHDLRAPIRAIHGFTKVLETSFANQVDAEGMKLLSSVSNAATRMGQLIDDLLHFSRIRRKDVQKSMVNMKEIVTEIMGQEMPTAHESSRYKVTIHELPDALCDKGLIRQVWLSLILNAQKFSSTKPQPVIEVGSRKIRNATVYYVKDNGVGFDMKYYDKLFNVFQRLHQWDEFPGTGIGLAIAHRIVVHHGGKMWAEGKVNEGSTFYFCLPK